MTVWTHTQGVYPDRQGIAEMLRMPPASVRLIHVEGSGCYGHNGADDAAADAALIARALPGRPVRVQWMREQEHAWEPFGPAMVTKLKASLDGNGKIADWHYEVWSNTHSMRPGGAGSMLAAQHMAQPFAAAGAQAAAAAGRRRRPQRDPDLQVSQRARGASLHPGDAAAGFGAARARRLQNVFSIESFMDELAALAGADPVEFRLEASRRSARPRRDRKGGAGLRVEEPARSRRRIAATALPSRATRIWRPIAPLLPRSR